MPGREGTVGVARHSLVDSLPFADGLRLLWDVLDRLAWDEVVETAQRYPVPRPEEGEGAAERCVLRLTACRVAIERGLPG